MTSSSTSPNTAHLKYRIYTSILASLSKDATAAHSSTLTRSLILDSIFHPNIKDGGKRGEDPTIQGTSITEDDVLRFSTDAQHRVQLDGEAQQQLEAKIDSLVSGMLNLLCIDEEHEALVSLDANEKAEYLLKGIRATQTEITTSEEEISDLYTQIVQTMTDINQHTETLRRDLAEVLSHIPEELNTKRAASYDLLAARIETALIKLSLMRARAERYLYDYKSEAPPHKTISQCLVTAQKGLKKRETDMKAEERELDRQLQEYEQLLAFMSTGGGYQQVIEDWSRVKQETEECKKDLRRLGWTE